jgi:hypothetical protein
MNDGGPHIVVAVMRTIRGIMVVLFELQLVVLRETPMPYADVGDKGMRLRNFVARLQISSLILELK